MKHRWATARRFLAVLGLLGVAGLIPMACGEGEKGDSKATTSDSATVVDVALSEWTIELHPSSAPAGKVEFKVNNQGTQDHTFVILKTDLPPEALPTNADGSANWNAEGIQVVQDIEAVPVGKSREITADLGPGRYAIICNIVETVATGAYLAHYKEGMHAGFTVE